MKTIIFILSILVLFSCKEAKDPIDVCIETKITKDGMNLLKDLKIISKVESDNVSSKKVYDSWYKILKSKDGCDFVKRRKVQWIKEIKKDSNNPIFNVLRPNQDFIRNVASYSELINNSMYPFYTKDNTGHFTIQITTVDKINFIVFNDYLNAIRDLLNIINDDFKFGEDFVLYRYLV